MSSTLPLVWDVNIEGKVDDFAYHFEFTSREHSLCLIGNNGAGKSTLIRALAGLETPSTGYIRLLGRTLFDTSTDVNLPPQDRWCGYIPQSRALLPHLTIQQNIEFALRARGQKESLSKTAEAHLQVFGLSHLRFRMPMTLSGGQYQRAALARTLLQTNAYLLLDEPLSSLDVENRGELRAKLSGHLDAEQVPAIISTHDDRDVIALSQQALLISDGKVTEELTHQGLSRSSNPFLAEFFRIEHSEDKNQ